MFRWIVPWDAVPVILLGFLQGLCRLVHIGPNDMAAIAVALGVGGIKSPQV